MVHAADKAERHRHRLLRQDDAKPWSKKMMRRQCHPITQHKRPLIFSGERSCCFCGLFAFGFCKQHVHVFRAGIPVAGGGLVLRHQAAGKAHAKAARLAELRDVLRRYAANGNIVCVVLESDNLGQEKNDL